ncbi:hypothetical protein SUGI_1088730 [Cryptomeria japonica]|nr:hypothetical protein SUGI_1088730 [Cryptomeria japonica]
MNRNEESGWSIVSCREVMLFISARGSEAHSVHSHKWKIDYLEWSPDCVKETAIAINGQYPGPAIKAQVGDTIVVEVENLLPTENVVIHWHGIHQIGTPWNDGTASVSQCPIFAGETYNYTFVVDMPGTYFYHGHYGLQRTAGLYGWLIVDAAEKEPFSYDGELRILLNDQWHQSVYEQSYGLSSRPMHWVGEPQSLLMEGRGKFNCSKPGRGDCNPSNPQCSPTLLPVNSGSTYRLRIASVASLSSLNFIIQGHKMTVVEADGHYVEPVEVDNLDVYSGESYSVLLKANQDPSRNYWSGVNVRSRVPMTPTGLSILNYVPNPSTKLPVGAPPSSPPWNDFTYSKDLAKKYVALKGMEKPPPLRLDRQLLLLNTQNYINGAIKWAINNISLVPPPTPYLVAMKYNIKERQYPLPNHSEVHPWHMHGHDFWILGYGEGAFDPRKDPQTFNLVNPPLRNTVPLFPYGWTAVRFVADNPGAWLFHCHLEAHLFMGMGIIFAEGIDKVGTIPTSTMGCGLTKESKY